MAVLIQWIVGQLDFVKTEHRLAFPMGTSGRRICEHKEVFDFGRELPGWMCILAGNSASPLRNGFCLLSDQ